MPWYYTSNEGEGGPEMDNGPHETEAQGQSSMDGMAAALPLNNPRNLREEQEGYVCCQARNAILTVTP